MRTGAGREVPHTYGRVVRCGEQHFFMVKVLFKTPGTSDTCTSSSLRLSGSYEGGSAAAWIGLVQKRTRTRFSRKRVLWGELYDGHLVDGKPLDGWQYGFTVDKPCRVEGDFHGVVIGAAVFV